MDRDLAAAANVTHCSYRTVHLKLRLLSPPASSHAGHFYSSTPVGLRGALRSPLSSEKPASRRLPSTSPPSLGRSVCWGHSIALMGPPVLSTDGGSCPSNPPAICRSKLAKSTIELRKPFASVTMKEEPFNFLRTLCGSQDDARFKTELENFYTGRNDVYGVVAGATAGVVVETVLYPIDTIKTRLQAGTCVPETKFILAFGISSIFCKNGYVFFIAFLRLLELEAKFIGKAYIQDWLATWQEFYRKASAIFVGIYEPTKQQLVKMFPENLSAVAHLVVLHLQMHQLKHMLVVLPILWFYQYAGELMTAGAIGGLAASLIRVPTEFTSAPNAVRLIAAKEGIRGLYAGYNSFLLRDLPFDAIQFCIYEQLRIGYKIAARRELNDPENALIGAFAGAITGAVTTPLDVMKTRLMVQGSASQYKGLINCAQTILKEEGPAAFLKRLIRFLDLHYFRRRALDQEYYGLASAAQSSLAFWRGQNCCFPSDISIRESNLSRLHSSILLEFSSNHIAEMTRTLLP
ncbi:hypothetical protein ZIOFF_051996 [Zingiber officinale]|uniref:Mitochondrial carrier protein n=1 Tax=Zingiber officinale TaxID=94328 RepID=A0A8J5FRY4_ZINOF|nr:hypothetical protein ZIOFF_051996 [Zingiber officinale]